jgi:uncharacterized protein YegP (UPF0339 family)
MYAAGSRLVAVSGDGYAEKAACVEAVNLLSGLAAGAVIRYAA